MGLIMFKKWWDWILSFFVRNQEERYDVYKPSERNVYHYHKGYTPDTLVKADPVTLWKKVMDKGAEIDADWKAASIPQSKFAKGARENLLKNVREVFGLKTFEEGGLSEWDAMDLLMHFMTYCGMLKKSVSPSPTSSSNGEVSTSSSVESPPTPSSSACSFAGTEQPTELPKS